MSVCDAIQNLQLLSFTYDGYARTAEPHTSGIDAQGHQAVRVYQVSGGSQSHELGWKLLHVAKMRGLTVLPQRFAGARPGYKRGDKAFAVIHCQL